MYIPPFTISADVINKIAEISRLIERYAILLEKEEGLRLRKANRIQTIHSSLAIEGNTLSVDEVRDIIDGKTIVAPPREIQEVKNAIKTYEMYPLLNPFKERDMLKAHAQMMEAIIDTAGHYRPNGVGVFSEKGLVHMAPPADRVPQLMGDLFDWLKHGKDHLLIRSCVFHYEFEFIHPFADGNGRMGRLWQSLILGHLHPLFEHLPIENMVFANQQEYYDAIATSTRIADSGPFINFMLGEILKTLKSHQGEELNKVPNKVPDKVPNKSELSVLALLMKDGGLTMMQLAKKMHLSESGIKKILASLKSLGLIVRIGSNKTGYWQVNEAD
ncbi:MAG: Fic family protein [Prevotella sp.]|nr:Fic family protein [Candidatus Equicola faecalis]